MTVISILALITAIAATVLAFIFIVPEKRAKKMGKLGSLIHNIVNFKFLIVEKILQATYIFATAFVIMLGVFMLFYVEPGYSGYYYSRPATWYGGWGLLVMIAGPIAVRIAYEFIMMALLLVKNVIQINNKLKSENGEAGDVFANPIGDAFVGAEEAPKEEAKVVEEAAPANEGFCSNCGTPKTGDFCSNCGQKF